MKWTKYGQEKRKDDEEIKKVTDQVLLPLRGGGETPSPCALRAWPTGWTDLI